MTTNFDSSLMKSTKQKPSLRDNRISILFFLVCSGSGELKKCKARPEVKTQRRYVIGATYRENQKKRTEKMDNITNGISSLKVYLNLFL